MFCKEVNSNVKNLSFLGPVCLLESSFFLESELFSDVWKISWKITY